MSKWTIHELISRQEYEKSMAQRRAETEQKDDYLVSATLNQDTADCLRELRNYRAIFSTVEEAQRSKKLLGDARNAIASLPQEALGVSEYGDIHWHIRDELLDYLSRALDQPHQKEPSDD